MEEHVPTSPSPQAHTLQGKVLPLIVGMLVLLCVGAMKLTASVTMPLAFSMFVVVLYEPLLGLLHRRLPRWLAALLTFVSVLATLVAVLSGLWLCATMVSRRAPHYRDALAGAGDSISEWIGSLGFEGAIGMGETGQYVDALGKAAGGIAQGLVSAAGGLVLVITFAMLAIAEAEAWKRKVRAQWGEGSLAAASTIASRCRSYVLTRTLTSALTGVLTGLLTWACGLDLAFVWGVTAFLLNYIPTVGSIIAIIPPTLLAYVQLGGPGALGVFAGLTVLQLVIGSYLDPKLQGKTLQLSPFVLLFSIGLWGWIWGVGGALLAVPLTMATTVICAQFPRSRWLATLLAEDVEDAPRGRRAQTTRSPSSTATGVHPRART